MTARLYGLSVSPWTEKARWALDHHRVPYDYVEYIPMLGELPVRLRTRKLGGKISAPLMLDRGHVLAGSFEIARYAEQLGGGEPLFPTKACGEWNGISEAVMQAARLLAVLRMAKSKDAQLDSVPGFVPEGLRAAGRPMAALGIHFLVWKYGLSQDRVASSEATIRESLGELRKALAGKPQAAAYVEGDRFTFADIAMAIAVDGIAPVSGDFMNIPAGMRACFTHEAIREEFADLVQWRDEVYAKHRLALSECAGEDATWCDDGSRHPAIAHAGCFLNRMIFDVGAPGRAS